MLLKENVQYKEINLNFNCTVQRPDKKLPIKQDSL